MKPGDKVTYIPWDAEQDPTRWEHGIFKSMNPAWKGHCFVVYHWSDKPENYENYTGQSTIITRLKPGWLDKEAYILLMPKGKELR